MNSTRSHMKQVAIRASLLVAFAGISYAGPASAQQWYLGAGLGSAQAKLGNNGTVFGTSAHETGSKLIAGYQFNRTWGIEGQYAYLGNFSVNSVSGGGSYKPESWSLAGTGTIPLANNFYLMGKLGATSNRLRDSNVGGGSTTDLLAGVGVGYNFNNRWGIRGEYENYGKMAKNVNGGGDVKGENWTISVKYSF